MKRSLFVIVLVAIIYCGTTLTSCKKNGPTVASITVLDTLGLSVPLATVTLWQDTAHNTVTGAQSTVRVSGTTGANGNVQFTFANEAFLNIWAIRGIDTAFGFIRLVQYQTTPATVRF
jgi:hypothetical protein